MIAENRAVKIAMIVLLVIVVSTAFIGGRYMKSVSQNKKEISAISFTEIDLADVPDGVYQGEYDAGQVSAKVQVMVKEHAIEEIDHLKHRNGKGQSAEKILDKMVEKQSVDVDAVSGATCSSKVLRKAVENALAR